MTNTPDPETADLAERPQKPLAYDYRWAPWVRGILFLAIAALGFVGYRWNERAREQEYVERADTWTAVWLDNYDLFSRAYANEVRPALESLADEGVAEPNQVFFFDVRPGDDWEQGTARFLDLDFGGRDLADLEGGLDSVFIDVGDQRVVIANRHLESVVRMVYECDAALAVVVSADGSSVDDPTLLAPFVERDMLADLQALEADALERIQADYDDLNRSYLIAAVGRWVALALIIIAIVVAEVLKFRTRAAVKREMAEYQIALAEFEQLHPGDTGR